MSDSAEVLDAWCTSLAPTSFSCTTGALRLLAEWDRCAWAERRAGVSEGSAAHRGRECEHVREGGGA